MSPSRTSASFGTGLRRSLDDRIRIGPAIPIPALLREHGVEPGPLLAAAGLDERLLDDPDNRIPFDVLGRLVHAAVEATGCEHFGLLVGQRFSPATIGPVYQLMRNSGSLREALRTMVLHLHLHDRGGVPYLIHPAPREVGVAYGVYHRSDLDVAPIYDAAMAIMFCAHRDLCGPRWTPLRVMVSHRRPADLVPYRRFFGAPLEFNAEHSAIVMKAEWLDAPLPGSDPALRAAFAELIREKEAAEALCLTDKVRRVLRTMVLAGTASAEQVAFMFAMSRRSLHRQLHAEGTSLQRLGNEMRFEVARQLLNETDMPAGDIASVLHYSDASAFSRAFKEWAGVSPREWRQGFRRGSPAFATGARSAAAPRADRTR
ncbi:MAG: AraC family transcriptional regulator [Gammaproteobacteria bacterium]|nr:AraC family transcriptional regulator [Gammaproteobacteria bacterium]